MRQLTERQKQLLQEAFLREQNRIEPLGVKDTQSTRGLLSRGLMEFYDYRDVHGKLKLGFRLTDGGYKYLADPPCRPFSGSNSTALQNI